MADPTGAGDRDGPVTARLTDRYRLGEVLGTGAMAEVRSALDERLGRLVAVKLLRVDLARHADVRRRFEAEARAAAALSHPSIVAVYDVDADELTGRPFLVMERLPGTTLADEIGRGPLTPAHAVDVGEQIAAALGAAHDAGILHRDVKPGNVLRADDGRWKVADFGIAKSAGSLDVLTATGAVLGTPGYVAPERLAGEPATPASDCYSLGVLLYEALAGRRPFVADTPLAVAHLARSSAPPPLDRLRAGLPPPLVDVVHRAMHRDPARRFGHLGELRDALGRVETGDADRVDGGPSTIPLPSPARTATRSVPIGAVRATRRGRAWARRLVAALVVGAGALGAVGLVVALEGGEPATPGPATPTTVPSAPAETGAADAGAPAPSVPPTLDDALRELEDAVQP